MKKIFVLMAFLLLFLLVKAQDSGYATFYGRKANNKRTASGAIYKRDSLVCAHRTYPFGTILKVRNLNNNKVVIVKVIDRGPFLKKRIVDLSYAAAKELDMLRHGVVSVEVEEFKQSDLPNNVSDTINLVSAN